MVNEQSWHNRSGNIVQDVGLSGLSRQSDVPVQNEDQVRMLNFGTVRSHYLHLQNGFKSAKGCRFCEKGLAGALETMVQKRPGRPDGVVQGTGTNQEGSDPPTRSDGTDPRTDTLLWP